MLGTQKMEINEVALYSTDNETSFEIKFIEVALKGKEDVCILAEVSLCKNSYRNELTKSKTIYQTLLSVQNIRDLHEEIWEVVENEQSSVNCGISDTPFVTDCYQDSNLHFSLATGNLPENYDVEVFFCSERWGESKMETRLEYTTNRKRLLLFSKDLESFIKSILVCVNKD